MFSANSKILVVDDMAAVRKLYFKILKDMGFSNLFEAQNGSIGWQLINDAAPSFDLVLSDWNMPQSTGIDLLKRVRADKRFVKLPFILITAESEAVQVKEAIESGVTDYLVKPFEAEILKAKLQKVYNDIHLARG